MEVIIKLLNSTGLILDIVGAWLVYIYVFNKPEPLITQSSIATSSKTKVINGIERITINEGCSLDLRAVQINNFNKYKERLFIKRARFGFYCLILGFFLQIISNFGINLNRMTVFSVIAVAVFFVFFGIFYLFIYLSNISNIPIGSGDMFAVDKLSTEKSVGIKINSDPAFEAWSRKVTKYCKRISR